MLRVAASSIERENNDEYVVNDIAMKRYRDSVASMQRVAEISGGYVHTPDLIPKYRNGSINAYFNMIDLTFDDVGLLCNALKYSNSLTVDANLEGVICVSYNIPDVFVKK